MTICIRKNRDVYIIDISEPYFGFDSARILRKVLTDMLCNNKINILINVTRLVSLNIQALDCIYRAQNICKKRGGQISLFGANPDVLLILYLIQFDKKVEIFNNEIDAIDNQKPMKRRRFKII